MISELLWQVDSGPLSERGSGLLARHVQRDLIDTFTLFLGTFVVRVLPRRGEIWLDSQLVLQLKHGGSLIWARTMRKELQAGGDDNSAKFGCLHYKVGIEDAAGVKHGWTLHEDGRMIRGIT